jgi:hypothetical protein
VAAERWRLVPGYPDYRVSNFGRVQSKRPRNGMAVRWRNLRHYPYEGGYRGLWLCRGGCKPHWFGVHQIVLLAFVGPCPTGQLCRHVLTNDGSDNRLENLAYGTHWENSQDMVRHGSKSEGERHPKAKLTAAQVLEARRAVMAGEATIDELARRHGLTRPGMRSAVVGRSWKCLVRQHA